MIKIDFTKAQEITKERLRKEREPLLQALDIEFQRNLEQGKDNSDVVNKKQELRDVTSKVNSCKTLDELKLLSC